MRMTPGLLIAIAALGGAGPAAGEIVAESECESYVASGDLGGYMIVSVWCDGASDYYAVDGVDLPNEWIDVPVVVPEDGCFTACVVGQCHDGAANVLRLSLRTGGGDELAATELTFTGEGIGCQYDYPECPGDAALCVGPGSYRLRVELVSGGRTLLDLLRLRRDDSPAAASAWSAVKRLY
jgi:hypothetical protein